MRKEPRKMATETMLSVIVPVYNCASYLRECVESLFEQKIEGLQIICIDDASTDSSSSVLSNLHRQHEELEVYYNLINRGLGATRNIGIHHAKGKYIMFVDADDYITPNSLKELIDYAETGAADVVLFDMIMFSDSGFKKIFDCNARVRKCKYNDSEGLNILCQLIANGEMTGTATSGVYKRLYLQQHEMKFIENCQHEDIPFSFMALLYAKKIRYWEKVVYHYRQRIDSILHNPDYEKLLIGLINGYESMQDEWRKFRVKNHCTDIQEKNIKSYFDSIGNLMEERYMSYLAEKNFYIDKTIESKIEKYHLVNKEEINQYLSDGKLAKIKNAKNIIIYGAGFIAKKLYVLLKKNGIEVNCFCVSDTVNNPDCLFARPVVKYSEQLEADYIVLAVSETVKKQILSNVDLRMERVVTLL